MTIISSRAMPAAGPGITYGLLQVLVVVGIIVALGEFAAWLLRYLPRSASRTISARLDRARAGAVKIGIHTGKGNLRAQLDALKHRKLGFIGRLRYVHARKRLLGPTPKSVLQSHSRRSYYRDMIRQFLLRCISLFRPVGIISAANLRILLLAGAIVMIRDEHISGIKTNLIHLRQTIPWHSFAEWVREWYVLVALVVVALIVATRSPMVDRIRARDEAAKDTNRLLAQLYAKLSDVQHSAAEYIKLIDESRTEMLARTVLKASGGLYTWTYSDGLEPRTDRFRANMPESWPSEKAERLVQVCKELADHLAEYRRNGLHTVAQRLTWPVFSSLFECRIMFYNTELCIDLPTSLLADFASEANMVFRDDLKMLNELESRGDHESRESWQIHTDNAIREYACRLDMRLAAAYAILLHLNHVNYFLNKRLHGNTRTRLASSFVR
jgi:hypothetical protein